MAVAMGALRKVLPWACAARAAAGAAPGLAEAPAPTAAPVPLYNCDAEYEYWEVAWSPQWKAWCCENEFRGCPSTTTTTATTTTATSTTVTVTTTVTRTSTTATETRTSTSTETSTTTRTAVRTTRERKGASHKNSVHEAQSLKHVSSDDPSAAETAAEKTGHRHRRETAHRDAESSTTRAVTTSTTSTPDLGCDAPCVLNGQAATCRERVRWAAKNQFSRERSPCEAAHVLVVSQCVPCGSCRNTEVCEMVLKDSLMISKKFLQPMSRERPSGQDTEWMTVIFAMMSAVAGSAIVARIIHGGTHSVPVPRSLARQEVDPRDFYVRASNVDVDAECVE